ncbi:MAG: tRNA preQ1(34) S-adenosylmethionine ribosyltransferase-isomerase QueA [Chthoniobacterales bacterium]
MSGRLSDYNYTLPEELIAQYPLPRREESRMMVLHRVEKRIEHRCFAELETFLAPGDLLVLNNTRVVNARRFSADGAIEFLFLEDLGANRWRSLVKPGRKMRVGAQSDVEGILLQVEKICDDGSRILALERAIDLQAGGAIPLPPYVKRTPEAEDLERYQTVFAQVPGAVAAPTAGLHFTSEMLARLPHTFVTLHVGTGTFAPVKTENIAEHMMHEERFAISTDAAASINAAQRVIAVGTTSVRVLEAATRDRAGKLLPQENATRIFLHPPQQIRRAQALLTNFHLPRSTLLMLVSAFAGREFILRAYAEAVHEKYRFYSYGDCMLIV